MKCNCVDGRIGRPDLPEGSETCWQCKGTGIRRCLHVEVFGANVDPEGSYFLPDAFVESNPFYKALREQIEAHLLVSVTLDWEDGSEIYTLEKVKEK